MEERFNKQGRLERSKGGGFYLVSENGKEVSVDQETFSVWSMFSNKTVEEMASLIMSDRDSSEAKKSIAVIANSLEKSGLLVKV